MTPFCGELRRLRPLLGTFVEIRVRAAGQAIAGAALAAGFDAIARVHTLMSFHNEESDVARLNARGHVGPVGVHPWTYRVIAAALEFSRASAGDFDCAVAPVLVRHGLLPCSIGHGDPGSWRDIVLLGDCRIQFARPLAIDLGGIAKGFAVDRAVEAILDHERVLGGSVNAGGDMRLFGPDPEPVFARDPVAFSRVVPIGMLQDGALATSSAGGFGEGEPAIPGISRIVDPMEHRLVRSNISVSVIAPDTLTADALTKPVLLRGAAASGALLAGYGAQALVLGAR